VLKENSKTMKQTATIVALFVSMIINIFLFIYADIEKSKQTAIAEVVETVEEPKAEPDTLSQWDLFTLALMKVESEYNPNAVSSVGARGYFQITPIYVKEVNRVHHTNFTFDQVTDFNTAYEIFDLMQQAHNPNYDMDKALTIHNGDHKWYKRRVYNAMEEIALYEGMRSKIKNI
jgi:hypothetical protein